MIYVKYRQHGVAVPMTLKACRLIIYCRFLEQVSDFYVQIRNLVVVTFVEWCRPVN